MSCPNHILTATLRGKSDVQINPLTELKKSSIVVELITNPCQAHSRNGSQTTPV